MDLPISNKIIQIDYQHFIGTLNSSTPCDADQTRTENLCAFCKIHQPAKLQGKFSCSNVDCASVSLERN